MLAEVNMSYRKSLLAIVSACAVIAASCTSNRSKTGSTGTESHVTGESGVSVEATVRQYEARQMGTNSWQVIATFEFRFAAPSDAVLTVDLSQSVLEYSDVINDSWTRPNENPLISSGSDQFVLPPGKERPITYKFIGTSMTPFFAARLLNVRLGAITETCG